MNKSVDRYRDESGNLQAYSWPGGYPVFYLDADEEIYCPRCANKVCDEYVKIIAADVNWKEDLHCFNCNERIESAYESAEEAESV